MKFNFKVFLGSLLITISLSALINFQPVSAQEAGGTDAPVESVLMATVNIYDSEYEKTGTNSYSISFRLHNRVGIQPNIRYGIGLIDVESRLMADLQLVNESITLGENEGRNITLEYTIPAFIPDGTYRIVTTARNQNGLPLATRPIGYPEKYVIIKNNNEGIIFNDCFLTVDGDAPEAKFDNIQGVDIKPEEKLKATCEISNNTSKDGDWRLQLITHKRTQFGDILANDILDQEVSIEKKATKTISFYLPIQKDPQAYDIDTFLIDSKGKKVSPSVYLHYVVAGNSATIQNVLLDKLSYVKGDTAIVKFLWTASADTFPGSRLEGTEDSYSLKVGILDGRGELCGSSIEKNMTPEYLADNTLEVDIEKDCINPKAELSIMSSDGATLDASKIDSTAPDSEVNINANVPYDKASDLTKTMYAVIFIVVLALISYTILYIRREKVENNN
jgi:hypothetical protein